jgi:hypothetical protein
MSQPMSKRSKIFALLGGALIVVLGVARAPSAATVVSTVYSGSECRPGSYNMQNATVTTNGHINSNNATFWLSPMCPIPRTNPTLPFVMVEAYFMDTSTSSEENANTKVTCHVRIRQHTGEGGTQDLRWVQTPSATLNGVFRHNSLMVSYASLEQTNQPFWTSITGAGAPAWQRADFYCDSLPQNTALRAYVVTERN